MPDDISYSWTKAAVLTKLKNDVAAGHDLGLQVFVDRSVQSDKLQALANAIVAEAAADDVEIGSISRLAKSFAVRGSIGSLARIAEDPRVASVLPSSVDDILPRPRLSGFRAD